MIELNIYHLFALNILSKHQVILRICHIDN